MVKDARRNEPVIVKINVSLVWATSRRNVVIGKYLPEEVMLARDPPTTPSTPWPVRSTQCPPRVRNNHNARASGKSKTAFAALEIKKESVSLVGQSVFGAW